MYWFHIQIKQFSLKHHIPSRLKKVSFPQETIYSPREGLYIDQGLVIFNSFLVILFQLELQTATDRTVIAPSCRWFPGLVTYQSY